MSILSHNKIVCVLSLCLIVTILQPMCCNSQPNDNARLFIFGDSVFDTGNNQHISQNGFDPAGHWPYGMSLNSTTSWRFSDGYLVPDYIAYFAKMHSIRPFTEPGTQFSDVDGVNFAAAGVNLTSQLDNMMTVINSLRSELGFEQASTIIGKSVFLFGLTGDDYFRFAENFPNASPSDYQKCTSLVLGDLTGVVKNIYGVGGRRFGFQNAPPLGCLPAMRRAFNISGEECAPFPQQIAQAHNYYLTLAMNVFGSTLDGFKHSVFDYYTQLTDRINNPKNYGFKVGNVACYGNETYCGSNTHGVCANPNDYVFFDGRHVTQNSNLQLAVQFWNGTGDATKPYTISELFELA